MSFADIFNSEHPLLLDGTLNMVIRVLPAPTATLRPETRFLLAARRKYEQFMIFTLVTLHMSQKHSMLELTLIAHRNSFHNRV